MAKTVNIIVRVDPETKARIEAAAKAKRTNVTTFVLDAVMRAAKAQEQKVEAPIVAPKTGVPTFFRALCETARAGGSHGYDVVGHEFARHVARLSPGSIRDKAWFQILTPFGEYFYPPNFMDNAGKALTWMELYFPEYLQLVPPRKRIPFLYGIKRFINENGPLG